jgi:AAA domain
MMAEAAPSSLVYKPATRGRFAPLLMISGPSGTGKTFSALRLAKGMAGPDGKIFVADTDNSRAKLYADMFDFMHLDLREPFRPMLFENAAKAAQAQKASVLVVDNFAAEWSGPGGVLEWAEDELNRMAGDNLERRESLKMVVWAKVKPPHKHMFQRLYQMNMAIILCCSAERKIAMVKQTEGRNKGKVIPVDQGFQPIGDKDAAYAMTASLLLEDVNRPGVPRAIKALLPDLKPIIHLDRPLDEETGARLAAWARGEKKEPASAKAGPKVGEESTADKAGETNPPESPPPMPPPDDPEQGQIGEPPPEPPPPEDDTVPPAEGEPPPAEEPPPSSKRKPTEEEIEEGAKVLGAKFLGAADRKEYFAIVDNADNRKQMNWLKRNRHELWEREVDKAQKASWIRTDQKNQQQGGLV